MDDLIAWVKLGIDRGCWSTDEAFTWLADKAQTRTAPAAYPASSLQQARGPSSAPKRRGRPPKVHAAPAFNKDGTPRKKPGRKPKQPAAELSTANGVE